MSFITQGKTNILYLSIILVVAVLAGSGIYYYSSNTKLDDLGMEIEITPKKVANNATADWKTYRNEEYGIEFNYPDDWIKPGNPYSPCDWQPFCLYVIDYDDLPYDSELEENFCPAGIDVCYKEGFNSYKNAFTEKRCPPDSPKDCVIKFIDMDGKNASQGIFYEVFGGVYVIETLLFTDNVRIQFSLELPIEPYKPLPDNIKKNQSREGDLNKGIFPNEETKEAVLLYNQMLSTFKFID